jgi:hypothetical protein
MISVHQTSVEGVSIPHKITIKIQDSGHEREGQTLPIGVIIKSGKSRFPRYFLSQLEEPHKFVEENQFWHIKYEILAT